MCCNGKIKTAKPLDSEPYYCYNTVEPYYRRNTVFERAVSNTVAFDDFSPVGGVPISLQIVRYIKNGIVSGGIVNGDEVPSRRVLSALLGVNPNTAQKAYRLLEDEGLLESRAGAKSFIRATEETARRLRAELTAADAMAAVNRLKALGLTKEEALALIEAHWN